MKGQWHWTGPVALSVEPGGYGYHKSVAVLWCNSKKLVDVPVHSREGCGARTVGVGGAHLPQPSDPT